MRTMILVVAVLIGVGMVRADEVPVLHFEKHVLVDAKGMTVYTFDNDTSTTSTCYGHCAKAWPPVIAPADQSDLPADVSTSQRKDGTIQLDYDGHPLYYYEDDKKPGDKTGDGEDGVWHLVSDSH